MRRIEAGRSGNQAGCVGGLAAALAISLLAPTGANADEPADAGASAVMSAEETEVVDAEEAALADSKEPAAANTRVPLITIQSSSVRVSYRGIRENRMGSRGSYRDRTPHSGEYSARQRKSERRGKIRYSGVSRGRLARYHRGQSSRIRTDGVTRRPNPTSVAAIRHQWMGKDRHVTRFGLPAY